MLEAGVNFFMFMRIKTIKEFERTCLKFNDCYIIDKNDFFRFPLSSKFWNDLIGKEIEAQEEGYYTNQGIKHKLYKIKDVHVPYWFFSEHKEKKGIEIE